MAKLSIQSFAKVPNEYVSIERSRGLSLLEEKLVYMLINIMQKRWEEIKKLEQIDYDYIACGEISFNHFRETMHIASKDNLEVFEALKRLFNFTLLVKVGKITDFMHLFEHMRVDEDKLTINYKFSTYFIEYFTGICRNFFKLSVEEVIGLNSTHAIRIYQLLKTKQNMDKTKFEFAISDLKKLLNIEKNYARYNDFKRKVIELAKGQINSSYASEFHIAYTEIKIGKAVTAIKFEIIKKVHGYYIENNQLAKYQIDLLKKLCTKWKKDNDKNSVVNILSAKILEELKHKKPLLVVIRNYLDVIKSHVKDDLTSLKI